MYFRLFFKLRKYDYLSINNNKTNVIINYAHSLRYMDGNARSEMYNTIGSFCRGSIACKINTKTQQQYT